ncbi:hypothetical protein INT43_007412 [Umbelopsis isabellina]|uniref:RRM domain-containing protein n=1 Tax=Mortierella isabellina TaxID=91625 RepID=A0A8H7UI21_MORIS|nr:hypothetical protein INT43_007412 [Umbelopsis isabellina]
MVEKKLSKKEQKALAFRKKGKKNAQDDEPAAVPESDLIDDSAPQDSDKTVKGKRARTDGESEKPEEGEPEKRYKKNRRPKKKNANHTGLILFVGNLPFDTTKADLEKHFESAEGLMSTRLMTDKVTKAPKGFAFLEFKDSECLQSALKFHHTLFKRRQINVELTAGGGGKSEARQEKLQVKREKLRTERQKLHEKSIAPANAARVASSYARRQAAEEKEEEEKAQKRQKYSATGVNAIGAGVQMRSFQKD